jgi:hypothetical protein
MLMALPVVSFGTGARNGWPRIRSETGTIDRGARMGIEDPELDVAEHQLALTDLDEDDEDDEELPASGQSPFEAIPPTRRPTSSMSRYAS